LLLKLRPNPHWTTENTFISCAWYSRWMSFLPIFNSKSILEILGYSLRFWHFACIAIPIIF
jgi:hypothetical protein